MRAGVILLNFGEPADPTPENVIAFLERIFFANASLEDAPDEAARRLRSRQLAERRAPGLIEEYLEIGGSPMNEQADGQAHALSRELGERGHEVRVYAAFQFIQPLVADVARQARDDGVEWLVGLPVYPLCGPSTNVAALDLVEEAAEELGWQVEMRGITGWHRHPSYLDLRADAVRAAVDGAGWSFDDPGTRLVFSAHGTPLKYIREGSRYVEYVEEFCAEIGDRLSADYEIGYQNHSNRGIEWTTPDVENVVRSLSEQRVVVDPVSFMHEQSETLAELDHELREVAEEAGLEFLRVPIPHDDARFAHVLADLVESQLPESGGSSELRLAPCRCRPRDGTFCLNSLPRVASVTAR